MNPHTSSPAATSRPSELSPLPIRRSLIGMIISSVAVIATLLLLYTQPFKYLGTEDGFMENLGALCFLITSGTFFWMFLQLRKANEAMPKDLGAWYWYLILAVLFFFITGEEISWGQRIFGWATPEWVGNNVQEETNIHNLAIFHGQTTDYELKPFWESLLVMNRMFSIFWLSWCLLLPLAVRFIAPIRRISEWFRVPLPNVLFGCLFFSIYASVKLFMIGVNPQGIVRPQPEEIKEAFFAIIFVMVSWNFVKRLKAARASQTGAA